MKYIVSISGGLGSAETLRRAIEKYGKENIIALFADIKGLGNHYWLGMPVITRLLHERFGGESRDTYRFIWQLSHHFDIPIERLESDESIWDVFARKRALRLVIGSIFFCPASEELKRKAIAKWINNNLAGQEFTMLLGMGWDEEHRIKSSKVYWSKTLGFDVPVISLNTEKPYASNEETALYFAQNDIEIPSAYAENHEHNNCNAGCVQAGQGHWANVFYTRQMVYFYWAWMEYQLGVYLGEYYTILKDSREGNTRRLSLYAFIERIITGDYRAKDGVACACFGNVYQLENTVTTKQELSTIQLKLEL